MLITYHRNFCSHHGHHHCRGKMEDMMAFLCCNLGAQDSPLMCIVSCHGSSVSTGNVSRSWIHWLKSCANSASDNDWKKIERHFTFTSNLGLGKIKDNKKSTRLVFIALLSQNRAEHGGFPPRPLISGMCLNLDVYTLAETLELSALFSSIECLYELQWLRSEFNFIHFDTCSIKCRPC